MAELSGINASASVRLLWTALVACGPNAAGAATLLAENADVFGSCLWLFISASNSCADRRVTGIMGTMIALRSRVGCHRYSRRSGFSWHEGY